MKPIMSNKSYNWNNVLSRSMSHSYSDSWSIWNRGWGLE